MKINRICTALLAACLLTACGGGKQPPLQKELSLKEALGEQFLVGVALNTRQVAGKDSAATALIKRHFNSIVAEDCMKSVNIHPEEHRYDFAAADSLVAFGEANGMTVIGHCLIWHSQLAPWFCVDEAGRKVSPETLKQRMKEHITTLVTRYKGRIKGWDVVNEAILEDGSYRKTPFYEILGEAYIPLAFRYAHEADPDAELYYNDYGMNVPGRREGVVKLLRSLKEQGLRIDAVGMQGHMGMDYPSVDEFETSIRAFAATGVKVMITEWDMSALPTVNRTANISDTVAYRQAVNPYPEALPDSVAEIWNGRMRAFLNLFRKHADVITRVTAWGLTDADSWKNNFPVKGRKDYPLLFDRDYQPKPFLRELLSPRVAVFNPLVYSVKGDSGAMASGEAQTVDNPLLPGCYPDPSICRVDSDYYLVNSSFAFYPGIPIWHSTDLKHWERIGYVLNRPSQLTLKEGLRISGGIYAPDIKYNPHNRKYYVISTDVDGKGTFFVTTDNPKHGRWSEPTYLPDVHGIDPSFLFDDDGKAYIVNNDAPAGKPQYSGHRAIWIREFDWKNGCTTGGQQVLVDGGVDITQQPSWIEGPHLYHIGATYFLMAAEGGTGDNHCEVVFSSTSPFGPFTPCPINPILTQRDLPADRPSPVTCTGHADLVQTPEGDWKAVFLGVRPYRDGHDVMGRETFLLPVSWNEGQPVILPAGKRIGYTVHTVPPTPLWTADGLSDEAFFIRTPEYGYYRTAADGTLVLEARSARLERGEQPSAISRWVTDCNFTAETTVDFTPVAPGDFAGVILFQNEQCHARFGKELDSSGRPVLRLSVYSKGKLQMEAGKLLQGEWADGRISLKIEGCDPRATNGAVRYTFSASTDGGKKWMPVGEPVTADFFSTKTAGGFTGTLVGIYATANYLTTTNH